MGFGSYIWAGIIIAVLAIIALGIKWFNQPKVARERTRQMEDVTDRRRAWWQFRLDRRADGRGLFGLRRRKK